MNFHTAGQRGEEWRSAHEIVCWMLKNSIPFEFSRHNHHHHHSIRLPSSPSLEATFLLLINFKLLPVSFTISFHSTPSSSSWSFTTLYRIMVKNEKREREREKKVKNILKGCARSDFLWNAVEWKINMRLNTLSERRGKKKLDHSFLLYVTPLLHCNIVVCLIFFVFSIKIIKKIKKNWPSL